MEPDEPEVIAPAGEWVEEIDTDVLIPSGLHDDDKEQKEETEETT